MTEDELLAAWRAEIEAGIEAKRLTRVGPQVTLWSQEPLQSDMTFRPCVAKLNCAPRLITVAAVPEPDGTRPIYSTGAIPACEDVAEIPVTGEAAEPLAVVLAKPRPGQAPPWSDAENEQLTTLWPTHSIHAIAKLLGRGVDCVKARPSVSS